MIILESNGAVSAGVGGIIFIPLVIAVVGGLLFLYWKLIAIIAGKRGRSTWAWFLLSFVISPIIVIILLLVIGETDEKRLERIAEEERIRMKIRGE